MKKRKKEINKISKTTDSKNKISINPLGDRVLVLENKEISDKTKSGIYIPEGAGEDRSTKQGSVVALGEGKYEDGKLVTPKVKIGDKILYQWGETIKYNGEEYTIIRESEILAIIK
ncbi:MAG: co-chaperone GroES [Candidatus Zambryskibacteria bacterium CG11_big_fil_rev_8_21_14_0_20_40_24]|uniref:Co-chaperonin GroES n=1 Tax=Candidatus Zambryskibacteria bacterium CG11_big_fil_rev_8_21_14_0_20_40_24 TaxID=1975116 RepID=A0A2H0K6Y8_9BACT|nr:MAG: co-chaperone GroES [Candidatus Zambryskibacteria bacterium CG11_big_fil_rev_8_21_14_0_20_40_24]